MRRRHEASGKKQIRRNDMVWVVVGDRTVIEPGIRALGWGDVKFLDADGKPL